jgi:hypothetical protein
LGLKPDLVYNPSVVAPQSIVMALSFTLSLYLIILAVFLTLRVRVCLYNPFAITFGITLEY